jgi:hypothetical protein
MRALELKVDPEYIPLIVMELAAPDAPAELGTVTVADAEAPAAMVPIWSGSGVAASAPTLTVERTTFVAEVPPVLEMVIWTTTLPPLRVSILVTERLAGVVDAGFTVMVVEAFAVV